jgi:YegS/Rv2252/BmrU family lipid kinase
MPLKPKIIYNPAAGKGSAGKMLPKVEALLGDHGYEYDLVLTEGPGHADQLARLAVEEGRDLVVAAGGDGTVNETINGLMHAHPRDGSASARKLPALGVLPVGRGNDFSFGMGIPHPIEQACDVLARGQRKMIDIGWVKGGDYPQGRYFGNGIGLGFDTVVGFEAAKFTRLSGAASYLAAVFKTIFLYAHAPVYELVIDGVTQQRAFLMVSIMNGRRMGGMFMTAPEGDPGDGLFDLCLVGEVSQARILPAALKFISGTQASHPAVRMLRARQISVRAVQGSIPAHADGETLCTAGQSLTIELCPCAFEIITAGQTA